MLDFIENLQTSGKLWFTVAEALTTLGCSSIAMKRALDKLKQKKRIVVIRGFVVIIPVEYKDWGIIPADWFIDPLMKFLQVPYYVGLLTAAEFHGAAHQRPMQFQIITTKTLRDIICARVHIKFISWAKANLVPTQRIQVRTGYAMIATPEATCLDLCRNYKFSGYWSNIATVIAELLETINLDKLCQLANSRLYDLPVIQRLGVILSHPEVQGAAIASALYAAINPHLFRWIPLNAGQHASRNIKNNQWKVIINEKIEIDI